MPCFVSILNTIVEKWCYFFKHAGQTTEADVKLVAGGESVIEAAYEVLNQFNWNEAELYQYERETKRIWDNIAAEDYIFDKGVEKGIQEGIEKTALKMFQQGLSIDLVKQITGLSDDVLNKLKANK